MFISKRSPTGNTSAQAAAKFRATAVDKPSAGRYQAFTGTTLTVISVFTLYPTLI